MTLLNTGSTYNIELKWSYKRPNLPLEGPLLEISMCHDDMHAYLAS